MADRQSGWGPLTCCKPFSFCSHRLIPSFLTSFAEPDRVALSWNNLSLSQSIPADTSSTPHRVSPNSPCVHPVHIGLLGLSPNEQHRLTFTWFSPDSPLNISLHAHKILLWSPTSYFAGPLVSNNGAAIVAVLWPVPFLKCVQATIQRYKAPIQSVTCTMTLVHARATHCAESLNLFIFWTLSGELKGFPKKKLRFNFQWSNDLFMEFFNSKVIYFSEGKLIFVNPDLVWPEWVFLWWHFMDLTGHAITRPHCISHTYYCGGGGWDETHKGNIVPPVDFEPRLLVITI